jgi:aryl-alcohol dehydrogenase-like predicted oxidoreductase
MQYGEVAGKKISRVVLGCASNAFRAGKNCDELLSAAKKGGINLLDTARGYGKSEEVIGSYFARTGERDSFYIQSKGGLHGLFGNNRVNEKCLRADLQKSLQALQTDRIDFYLLHRDNEKLPVGEIVELLNDFQNAGMVRTFGVSNWDHRRIESANEYAYRHGLTPLAVSEPQFSLAEVKRWTWIGCRSVTGAKGEEERAWYRKTQFPLMAFSPLGGGFLSGKVKSGDKKTVKNLSFDSRVSYVCEENMERLRRAEEVAKELNASVAEVALAWLFAQNMNVFAVVGSGSARSLQSCIAATGITLTDEQATYLTGENLSV